MGTCRKHGNWSFHMRSSWHERGKLNDLESRKWMETMGWKPGPTWFCRRGSLCFGMAWQMRSRDAHWDFLSLQWVCGGSLRDDIHLYTWWMIMIRTMRRTMLIYNIQLILIYCACFSYYCYHLLSVLLLLLYIYIYGWGRPSMGGTVITFAMVWGVRGDEFLNVLCNCVLT